MPCNDSVVGTITVGTQPLGLENVSGGTKVYVANNSSSGVTIIDSVTSGTTTVNVPGNPREIAWGNNKAFVTLITAGQVVTIDTNTQTTGTTISVGPQPFGITYDDVNDQVYVCNAGSNNVSVIDATTDSVISTVTVGSNPYGVDWNSVNNRVYVANQNSGDVSVIDTSTNTVVNTISGFTTPYGVAVNNVDNTIYVTDYTGGTTTLVRVIDGVTETIIATIPAGNLALSLGYNSDDNRIYVANNLGNNITIIDCNTNTVCNTITVGNGPFDIIYNPFDNYTYITNAISGTVTLLEVVPDVTPTPTPTLTPTLTPTVTYTPTVTPTTSEPLDIYSFQSCCDSSVKFRYINVPGILSVGEFYLISGGTGFEGCAEVITLEDTGSIYSSAGVTFTQQDDCMDLDCPPCPSPTPTPTVTPSSPLVDCNCLSYTIINPYDVTEYLAYEDCLSVPQNIQIEPASTTIICACEGSLFNEGSLIVTQNGECPPPTEPEPPTPTPTPTITVTPSTNWNLCDDDFCLVTYDPTLDLYNGTYTVSGSSLYNNRYVFSGDVTGVIYYNSTSLQWCLSDTIGGTCLLGGPSPSTSSCPDLWNVIFTNGVCNTTTSTTSPCDVFDFNAYFDCDVPVTPSPTPTNTPTPSFTPTPTPTTNICNYFTGDIGISGYTTTTTTTPEVTTTTTTICYSASSGTVTYTVVNSLFICPGEVYVFIDCVTSQIYYVEPINAFADVDLNDGYVYSFNINEVPTCATFDGVQEISPNVVASGPVTMFTGCKECQFATPTPTPTPTVTPTITNTPTVTPTNTVTPSITPTGTVTPTPSSATLDTSKQFWYQYFIGSSGTISFNTVTDASAAKTVICDIWDINPSGASGYGSNFIPPLNVGTFVAQTTIGSFPMPAGNYVVGDFTTVEGPTSVNYWVVINSSGIVTQYTLIDPNC